MTALAGNKCRLCLSQRKINLIASANEEEKMLQSLTALEIAHSEKNPSGACPDCLKDLRRAYAIQQSILALESNFHSELVADFFIEHHDELMNAIRKEQYKLEGISDEGKKETSTLTLTSPKLDSETTPVKHKCHICLSTFQFSPNYIDHLHKHIAENKSPARCDILCEHCGDFLTSSDEYNTHLKELHSTPSECYYCRELFPTNADLDKHLQLIHFDKKKPFVCTVCNARFAVRYLLIIHKGQHNIVKPFACDICGKKFKQQVCLRIHQTTKHGGAVANASGHAVNEALK